MDVPQGFDPTLILVLNLAGTFVFGLSGGLAAVRANLDLFGVVVLAAVVGLAGGITRDVLIGTQPATFRDWRYLAAAAAAGMVCFFAGRRVRVDDDELNAAVRRAELLLAAGGDPRRRLDPLGRAATALAEDLDAVERRTQLHSGLEALVPEVEGLRGASESLALLLNDRELAWQAYAASLLAEALADD